MENSAFNRSNRTVHTPPSTPAPAPAVASPQVPSHADHDPDTMSTPELQAWMSAIDKCLNEVCAIATEGKLNSDQKLRIHNICRKVGYNTSQLVVEYQYLKAKTAQVYSTVQTLRDELDLSCRLKDLKQTIEESSKPFTAKSFADMVKQGNNNYIQPTNLRSIAIYPNDKLKSSEETKSLVQKMICPEEMKLQVRGLRKTRNGGIIISTETKDDIEKVKQTVQQTSSNLKVDEPSKRKPRVIVIGVPTNMNDKDVFKCIYQQNLADRIQDLTIETYMNSVKLSHKSGKKDAEVCNYVLEVSANIRKALIAKERVYVNWSSCPVRDFTLVTRCYKCQQYGHAAKSCRELNYTCGHCGDEGHTMKDCVKKAEDPKCATCLRYMKPYQHNTGATDCPAKVMAERKYINSIDYESI